jgi:hypothetical protein
MTYTFTRSQTNIIVSLGAVSLAGSATDSDDPVIATVYPDLFGPVFGVSDLAPTPAATPSGALHQLIISNLTPANATVPGDMVRAVFFGAIAIGLAFVVYIKTRWVPLSLFIAGLPLAYATIQDYLDWWWLILWGLFTIMSWFAVRLGEER